MADRVGACGAGRASPVEESLEEFTRSPDVIQGAIDLVKSKVRASANELFECLNTHSEGLGRRIEREIQEYSSRPFIIYTYDDRAKKYIGKSQSYRVNEASEHEQVNTFLIRYLKKATEKTSRIQRKEPAHPVGPTFVQKAAPLVSSSDAASSGAAAFASGTLISPAKDKLTLLKELQSERLSGQELLKALEKIDRFLPGFSHRLEDAQTEDPDGFSLTTFVAGEIAGSTSTVTASRFPLQMSGIRGAKAPAHLGIGLPNPGTNNCFLWSMMQILLNNPRLRDQMLPHLPEVVRNFAVLYLRHQDSETAIPEDDAKTHGLAIRSHYGFKRNTQEDATEVLARFGTLFSEEAQRGNKLVCATKTTTYINDGMEASSSAVQFGLTLFQLLLPPERSGALTLPDMYATQVANVRETREDRVDPSKPVQTTFTIRQEFTPTAPEQLIFTFTRITQGSPLKNQTPVDCPDEMTIQSRIYRLKSFVAHREPTIHSGHYVSANRNDDGRWTYFNDNRVVIIDDAEAKKELPQAVMVYYEAVDADPMPPRVKGRVMWWQE